MPWMESSVMDERMRFGDRLKIRKARLCSVIFRGKHLIFEFSDDHRGASNLLLNRTRTIFRAPINRAPKRLINELLAGYPYESKLNCFPSLRCLRSNSQPR